MHNSITLHAKVAKNTKRKFIFFLKHFNAQLPEMIKQKRQKIYCSKKLGFNKKKIQRPTHRMQGGITYRGISVENWGRLVWYWGKLTRDTHWNSRQSSFLPIMTTITTQIQTTPSIRAKSIARLLRKNEYYTLTQQSMNEELFILSNVVNFIAYTYNNLIFPAFPLRAIIYSTMKQ